MTVVVGFSDSPLGHLAIDRAMQEATMRDLPLVLTSHVPMPRSERDAGNYAEQRREVETQVSRAARELAGRGARASSFVPATPTDAADALLAAAEEHDAELIVVGIRRRSPVGKAVLGSTAQDVLLAAPCAVLGVKLPSDVEESR